MRSLPPLVFPTPARPSRHKSGQRPRGKPQLPDGTRQHERLDEDIRTIPDTLAALGAELRAAAEGSEPECAVVFETINGVDGFAKAVVEVRGLRWLSEQMIDSVPPDDDFYHTKKDKETGEDTRADKHLDRYVYLVMADQAGAAGIVELWEIRQARSKAGLPRGKTKWGDVFELLHDVRVWGPTDRIAGTQLDAALESTHDDFINVEIELWCRVHPSDRQDDAERRVRRVVDTFGGATLDRCLLREIAYHSLLTRLPRTAVVDVLACAGGLVDREEVMFFRPDPRAMSAVPHEGSRAADSGYAPAPASSLDPVAALLDGLPVANHVRLANRVVVDDPDDWAPSYSVAARRHGTEMASLIVHGDIGAGGPPLQRPVYVRPVLQATRLDKDGKHIEEFPTDRLLVDVLHRAVRDIFEGTPSGPAASPGVRVISLSLGDDWRSAGHYPSPLARLLDWLSHKYKVLFVVSAGNYPELPLNLHWDTDLATLSDEDVRGAVLRALYNPSSPRHLLTPAESINALTVGALHDDASTVPPPAGKLVDPYRGVALPSPLTAQGSGFRKAVKPEIHAPGGRQLFLPTVLSNQDPLSLKATRALDAPGQRVAVPPSISTGGLNEVAHTAGTSNAAAIVTRTVARQYERLLEHPEIDVDDPQHRGHVAALLKALAVHRAAWGEMRKDVEDAVEEATRRGLPRLLGYGSWQGEPVVECTDQRATIIAYGTLSGETVRNGDGAHQYELPIPAELSGVTGRRRLVITLAWLTPVNPFHRAYRGAALWFERFGDHSKDGRWDDTFGIEQKDVRPDATRRGTVQHEVWEGDRPVVVEDDASLQIKINCRDDAGKLTKPVPYGLAVTMEVAPDTDVSIYDAIQTRLRQRTPVRPQV